MLANRHQDKLTPAQEKLNRKHAELTAVEVLRNAIARKVAEGAITWEKGKGLMGEIKAIKLLIEGE